MYRLGIVKKDGKVVAKNFKFRSGAEDYLLTMSEKESIKRADLLNVESGERERIF